MCKYLSTVEENWLAICRTAAETIMVEAKLTSWIRINLPWGIR